jgi:hypothetical protein
MRNYDLAEQIGMKEESALRRATNQQRSCALLRFLGVEFEVKNEGVHLIVKHNGKTVDFWPSTGKYIPREPKPKHGRGVFNMLKMLGIDPKTAKEHEEQL